LLLLPGLMCDSRIFEGLLGAFPEAVPAADYGRAATLQDMAKAVLAGAPERFGLLGHSMGARVALEVFRLAPDRVERIALVSTGVHLPGPDEAPKRYALRDIGRRQGMAALVDAWLPPMIGPARAADAALYRRLRAMCVEAGLERFEAQIAALLARPEVESLLPRIRVPALVAVGSDDRWSPPDQHQAMAALIPGAQLEIIDGAGHMLPAERPEALNVAVAGWLARSVLTA
jgi:pimeloyl-ACP methyl ester carboxylesterase